MAQDKRLLAQVYKGPDTHGGALSLFYPDGTMLPNQVGSTITGGVGIATHISVDFVVDNSKIILCSLDEFEQITGKKCGSP